MPTPKSVVKINKDGVKYISSVDKCEYYIHELCRAALRDSAKFCAKKFKTSFYNIFHKITGNVGRNLKYKVWSSKSTKYPRVELGLKPDGFYGGFQEFGTKTGIKKYGLLRHSVEDNIDEIIKIQKQYLSALDKDEQSCEEMLIEEDDVEEELDE